MGVDAMKTKSAFIIAHASEHAIRFMCRVTGVTRSCYYAWQRAAPRRAERASRRDSLGAEIEAIFFLSKKRYKASMSRKGNCLDNAPMRASSAHSKLSSFATRREDRAALFEYIEIFYNRQRRHSSIGYRTPAQARMDITVAKAA